MWCMGLFAYNKSISGGVMRVMLTLIALLVMVSGLAYEPSHTVPYCDLDLSAPCVLRDGVSVCPHHDYY
jgi:hypothetical protein